MLADFKADFLISQVRNDPKTVVFQRIFHKLGIFRLFARNIERGMVRTLPEEDAILSAYQKKTSICAYLTRDYLQNKLCSS